MYIPNIKWSAIELQLSFELVMKPYPFKCVLPCSNITSANVVLQADLAVHHIVWCICSNSDITDLLIYIHRETDDLLFTTHWK